MTTLWLACGTRDRDELIAELWQLGTLGITEHDFAIEAFFEEPFDASRFAGHAPRWHTVEQRDWVAEARALWQPLEVGTSLFLVPDWRDDPAPAGRRRLVVHAGQASGSGYSVPTQLTLEMLERHLRAGETMLDVGTGSGILTAAAALLGAGKCVACDIDLIAAGQARVNLLADGHPALVIVGSPRSLRSHVADLALANLNAVALISAATELRRVLRPSGSLIACGFRPQRADDVIRALTRAGFEERDSLVRNAWRCVLFS